MATYSSERKAEFLQILEVTEHLTVSQLAKEEGISKSTLQGWIKQAAKEKRPDLKSFEERMNFRREILYRYGEFFSQ